MFGFVSAHEAYVLDKTFFWKEMGQPFSLDAFNALKNTDNIHVAVMVFTGVLIVLIANYFIRRSKLGEKINRRIEKLAPLGPIFARVAISVAFFYSALSNSFLGPELTLSNMPLAIVIKIALFAVSVMIFFGIFTELAALVALFIFTTGFFVFGQYIFTYLNYLGEIIVLLLFGMRKWSFDGLWFGVLGRFKSFRKYDTTIVRVFYGLALIFAGVTVKFLHPNLMVNVVNTWHLNSFHWLFPHDPLLITLGAGFSEIVIGFFILIGFEMRLTVFISLIYITMSLLYFKELVWPHLMLYGISLNLIVQPEVFTMDHILFDRNKFKLLKRPFLIYNRDR